MDFIEQILYYTKKIKKISAEHVRLIHTISLMVLPWTLNYNPSEIASAIMVL